MQRFEKRFSLFSEKKYGSEKISTIVASNFMELGRMTALHFIYWAIKNPEGRASLPTGKTPQFFIEWVMHYKGNWSKCRQELLDSGFSEEDFNIGFSCSKLHFIQIDEFFPIKPQQTNSFYYYIQKFYISGFGFDPKRALLMRPEMDLNVDYDLICPAGTLDFSLQFADNTSLSSLQKKQKALLLEVNQYTDDYEQKIRDLGGIDFFLGGIGPDGHIGFNVRGSSHFSTTRLTPVNYETMAASAGDLGGIQKEKLVLTIGLDTITRRDDATILIMAAGDAKAKTVHEAVERSAHVLRPASVLQKISGATFYLTPGAASKLNSRNLIQLMGHKQLGFPVIHEILCLIALEKSTRLHKVTLSDLATHERGRILIEKLSIKTDLELKPHIEASIEKIQGAIAKGQEESKPGASLHTAPHHDDLILGIFPKILREIKDPACQPWITVLTSGFTAVTNSMFLHLLQMTEEYLKQPHLTFQEFQEQTPDQDCQTYISGLAAMQENHMQRARVLRFLRDLNKQADCISWSTLDREVCSIKRHVTACYPGQKDPENIQVLKGALREFEEELLWTTHGLELDFISHPRLTFYKGDIFNCDPGMNDAEIVLQLLKKIQPRRISLALDPEGSGPDTHYKVLLAISRAVALYCEAFPERELSIIGYRNVWNRFQAWEADVMIPMTLPEVQAIDRDFKAFYFSQVKAPFPSPDYNGPFSEYSQKIWVAQKDEIRTILGESQKDVQAMIYYKVLTPDQLIEFAEERKTVNI